MELIQILKWLILLFLISWFMRPYLRVRNLALWDAGFALSLGIGTALSFFTSWILSALGLFPFDEHCLLWVIVLILLPALALVAKKCVASDSKQSLPDALKSLWDDMRQNARRDLKPFLCGFALFTLLFALAVWMRGFKPELSCQTEQYMDFGFVKTIYRQRCAVPEDIWFSGNVLNYYYLGQACTAFLCRLSCVSPRYGYPLMLSTLFAGMGAMVFTLAGAILTAFFARTDAEKGADASFKRNRIAKTFGALLALLATTFAGNGHYLYYGILIPIAEKITGRTLTYREGGYFFPDSTVYIGNYPDMPDKGKNEFMAYSVILGDLHAHMINLLFVVPLLAIAVDYALDDEAKSFKDRLPDSRYVLIAVLLALFMGCNYWDFPIYYVIAGALILFHDLAVYKDKVHPLRIVGEVLLKGALIIGVAKLLARPFEAGFTKMASEICLCKNHTPFYKFALLWGIPVVLCGLLLLYLFVSRQRAADGASIDRAAGKDPADVLPLLILIVLISCATGLILVPEVIFVKDIYGDEYARFNTMFKLTYQAFWLFGITLGIAAGIYVKGRKKLLTIITAVPVILLSTYLFCGAKQFMGNLLHPAEREGIDALDFLTRDADLYAEMNAIYFLDEDPREHVRILEVSGESYSTDCKLSAMSGACTYVGWNVHEWMWRGGWDIVGERAGEVRWFYECGDPVWCKDFLNLHAIDYVFAGPREYTKYAINEAGFAQLGEVVFRSEEGYCLFKVR